MNSAESLNNFVEDVEVVEKSFSQRVIEQNLPLESSTKFKSLDVESVEAHDLIAYFSTLSTKLKSSFVENLISEKRLIVSDLDGIPQIPHFPREQKDQLIEIFKWLQIVFDEGHIEPSQPCVGKILGWPQFSHHKRTLWTDFNLWCRKNGLKQIKIADSHLFFSILDQVFERINDRYEFPPLEVCQNKYLELKGAYESFTISK